MWLGIVAGGMFTTFLMAFRMKSAIVLGIILVSVMSWP
jgi:AGZA family xanthine/uracil permease-like MFS transporter